VPIPWFLPLVSNNAGQEVPECQLVVPPPANPSGVDLIVTAISLNPNPPQAGQEAVVRVTVKNQGTADVPAGNNFLIDFYDNPSPEPPGAFQAGNVYWGVQGSDFEAGESVTLVGSYTFQNPGFHHLYAQVDTDRAVNEANENNNVYGCLGLTIN
jgi:subtilase family serine protease